MKSAVVFAALASMLMACGAPFEGTGSDAMGAGGSGSSTAAVSASDHAGSGGAATMECVPGSADGIPACQCVNGLRGHPICDSEGNFGSCAVACGETTQECVPGVSADCHCGPNAAARGTMLCDSDGNWTACASDLCAQLDKSAQQNG